MSESNDTFNPFDPTGMLKTLRDSNMDVWSKMMIQLVNTDAYSQATGKIFDTWLSTSAPFRKVMETVMTQVLANLNMPNRGDVICLAERLVNIERRLDDLEACLEEIKRSAPKTGRSKSHTAPGENQS